MVAWRVSNKSNATTSLSFSLFLIFSIMSKTELAFTAAKQAVEHDSAGRVQDAIYYYELSVDLLKDEPMQPGSPFIDKMNEYSARAAHLRSTTPIAVVRVSSNPPPKEEDRSPLGIAVTTAEKAVAADNAGKYSEAVILYMETCELFLQLINHPDVPPDTKSALRERLSAYTVRKEVVQRLHEQSRSSSSSLPSSSYSHPLSQNNTHPYLTHAQPTSFQQIAPPTATPYGQPTTQSGQPTTYYPTNTPVSNPIPFSMGAGQTRYVDPLHKPTLMERLKKLGL